MFSIPFHQRSILKVFVLLFLIIPTLSYSQGLLPVYKSSVTNTGGSGNATVNKPSGVENSDLLVVGLMYEKGSSETITPPTGWTLVRRIDNSTDIGMATYYRVVQDKEKEPSSYSFNFTQGSKWAIGITHISNINTSRPIDISNGSTGFGQSVTAPSLTTTGDNRLVLCFYTNKKSALLTPASSTAERYDAPNTAAGQPANMMASFEQASAGATGHKAANAPDNEKWAGQQVAITPADLTVLPVELVDFTLKTLKGHGVVLSWATASEQDNSHFVVERSSDLKVFKEIGQVVGAGSSSIRQHYTFTDGNPMAGTSYYRLRQVDYDGAFEYSPLRASTWVGNPTQELTLSPNPATAGTVLLRVQGLSPKDADLEIMDLKGRRVLYQHLTEPVVSLSTGGLKSGAYLVRVSGRSGTLSRRLIIQ